MEIEGIHHESESGSRRKWLNDLVAITIVLLVTFVGVCKVKDGNTVQAMHKAQANRIDAWTWYQARHVREDVANSAAAELDLQSKASPASVRAEFSAQAKVFKKLAEEQAQKKSEIQASAEGYEKEYEKLDFRHTQFDLADASISIAIAILAITSLTQMAWLYGLSLVPAVFGAVMGLAGFWGWQIHPDALARLIGI